MRKIYSRPETRLRACIRPTKENANNLPFFRKSRKARRPGPDPAPPG
jgi:hypothetical protein